MEPISTVSAILSSVQTIQNIANTIRSAETQLNEAELKMKMADLLTELSDVKANTAMLKSALIDKDEDIKRLLERLMGEMIFEKYYYYRLQEDGSKIGPYCSKCYDSENKFVRLIYRNTGVWYCPVCNRDQADDNFIP